MLIVTLLFLATASLLFFLLRRRHANWQARVALTLVAIVSWMCSLGAYGLAIENTTQATGISWPAKILIAGFLLYPLILWMAVTSFERGRKTGMRDV